jgi:hypothetical protein
MKSLMARVFAAAPCQGYRANRLGRASFTRTAGMSSFEIHLPNGEQREYFPLGEFLSEPDEASGLIHSYFRKV